MVDFGDRLEDWTAWRATMTAEHQVLKEGVANFRAFQARGATFFDRAEAVWAADKSRRARNLVIVGIIAAMLTPGIWAATDWISGIVNKLNNVLQIEEEWKQAHSSEFVKPQPMETQPDPPQNAKDEQYKLAY